MGWCREGSDFTTHRIRLFPARDATYTAHKGMESKACTASKPGRPVKKKEVLVWLESDMMTWKDRTPVRSAIIGPRI